MMNLSYTIDTLFTFYFILIILNCFLTWIPNIDMEKQPIKSLRTITEPFLGLFRKFIPPVGGLDFSPVVALIALQIIQQLIVFNLRAMGL